MALLAATAAGILAGIITGLIHVKGKVRDLLSGIITMTGLYSVNLRIAGSANVPLFQSETIFNNNLVNNFFTGILAPYKALIIIIIMSLAAKIILDLYLKTRSGCLLQAVGDNHNVVTALGKIREPLKLLV